MMQHALRSGRLPGTEAGTPSATEAELEPDADFEDNPDITLQPPE